MQAIALASTTISAIVELVNICYALQLWVESVKYALMSQNSSNKLSLTIKDYWDYPQTYVYSSDQEQKNTIGVFVGRVEEKDKLKDLFNRKSKGSILISGPRGVGKTSLVYRVIYELQRDGLKDSRQLLPIVLNASQLEIKNDNGHFDIGKDRFILINLISQLSSTYEELVSNQNAELAENKPNDIINKVKFFFSNVQRKHVSDEAEITYQDIENLYRKAVAKKWELEKVDESFTKLLEKTETSKTDKSSINFSHIFSEVLHFIKDNILFYLSMPALTGGAVYLATYNLRLTTIGLIISSLTEIVVTYKREEKIIHEKYRKQKDKVTYKIDNSFSTLESQFQEVLKKLAKKFKVIFVIDELDKIQKSGQDNLALDLIKIYKNLFTHSPGLFVFIGNKDLYNKVLSPDYENNEYLTLFTDHIFLSVPTSDDLSSFYENILEDTNENRSQVENSSVWIDFQKFISFKAKANFFVIIHFLKDYINKEGDKLKILVDLQQELSARDKAMSQAFKAIEITYNGYYRKQYSSQSENHELLSSLFDVVNLLRGQGDTGQIRLDLGSLNQIEAKAFLLNNILIPSGIFRKVEGEENKYEWTRKDVDLVDKPGPFPYESNVINKQKEFLNFIDSYGDENSKEITVKKVSEDFSIDIENNKTLQLIDEMKMQLKEGKHIPIENSEKLIDELNTLVSSISQNSLEAIKHRLLKNDPNLLATAIPPATNLLHKLNNFVVEYQKLGIPIPIVHTQLLNKQVIFISQANEALIKEFEKVIGYYASTYAVVYSAEKDFNVKNAFYVPIKIKNLSNVINTINSISRWIEDESYVLSGVKGFVKSGMLSHYPNETTFHKVDGANYLGSSTHSLLKFPITNFSKKIEARALVNLKDTALLNIGLVFINQNGKEEWVFGRLDTRKTSEGNVDGILTKSDTNGWLLLVPTKENEKHSDSNTDISIKITFMNGQFHFYKSNKKIASMGVGLTDLREIVLFNEVEDVIVKSFDYKAK